MIREVRDTLYDLRTDVSEEQDLAETLEQYVARVTRAQRASQIQVEADRGARLPILQEREMWRIAQEALTNVERHAQATAVRVAVALRRRVAPPLDVTDNGVGFPTGPSRPPRLLRHARHAGAGVEHRRHASSVHSASPARAPGALQPASLRPHRPDHGHRVDGAHARPRARRHRRCDDARRRPVDHREGGPHDHPTDARR